MNCYNYTRIKLINDDCLCAMTFIPDKSVDMILCDPPFGVTDAERDIKLDSTAMFNHCNRLIKDNGAMVFFATNPFAAELIAVNKKYFRYDLVWKKNKPVGFLNANKMPLRSHELILVFYKKLPAFNPQLSAGLPYTRKHGGSRSALYGCHHRGITENSGTRRPASVLEFKHDMRRHHPTQKPNDLLQYLIKTYTDPGDTVLDFCMGAGSTSVAAVQLWRDFVGIELDKNYYDISVNRIHEAISPDSP